MSFVLDHPPTTFASQQAPIKAESRIDTPKNGKSLTAGRVTVAGVAWAQHKGIRQVEVAVDGGAWQNARLSPQDSPYSFLLDSNRPPFAPARAPITNAPSPTASSIHPEIS